MVVVRARSNPIDMIVFVIRMQSQLNEHRKNITETEESVKDTINSCFNKFSFVHDS